MTRRVRTVTSLIAAALVAALVMLVAPERAGAAPFVDGDVFVGLDQGRIEQRTQDGTLKDTLDTTGENFVTGMAFDATGRLYATSVFNNTVSIFDTDGDLVGNFGTSEDHSGPAAIVFDAADNAYVANFSGGFIAKFDPSGNLLDTFDVATTIAGMDLAGDQCTMFYTDFSSAIFRHDVCTDAPLANFTTTAGSGGALRIRPDGTVLVAGRDAVRLLSSSGAVLDTYDQPERDNWFALNLDPDGTSFWTADAFTAEVFNFDIATGAVLETFVAGGEGSVLFGLAVAGEITAAQPSLDLAPVSSSNPVGTSHTLAATAREGGEPAVGVTVTFRVVSGPNVGLTRTAVTNGSGVATASYSSSVTGTDTIEATFEASGENTVTSNQVTKTWTQASKTIVSSGPLEQITIRNDLGCAVLHSGVSEGPDFQAFNGANGRACGTFLTVGSTLFGPADIPGGAAASPRTTFTPVSQTGVTGAGTAADPFKIVTVVQAGTTGVRVTQTDTYVALPAPGQNVYRTTVQVTNTSGTSRSGIVYRAGDCNLLNNDNGFGQQGAPPPPVSCLPSTATPGLVLEWIPTTGGARYYEATATEVWTRIGTRQAFPNQCLRCTQNVDNAAGLSWNYSLGANQFNTLASAVNFRHDHDSEVIGPGGGSASTGNDATPADPTVSTFTLPPGGPGATITIDERPAPPGFKGQEVEIQPFSGYNNFANAPTLRITYDASINPTLNDKTYYVKPTSAFPIAAQPCNNATQVSPCIVSQIILANGDLVIVLKVLSDDIGFRRR